MVINNKVYDVTKFMYEHPGGDAVLMENAGGDGTTGFEDVAHTQAARKQMEEFYVGEFEGKADAAGPSGSSPKGQESSGSGMMLLVVAVIVVAAAVFAQQKGYF